jgi:hypothetical protein
MDGGALRGCRAWAWIRGRFGPDLGWEGRQISSRRGWRLWRRGGALWAAYHAARGAREAMHGSDCRRSGGEGGRFDRPWRRARRYGLSLWYPLQWLRRQPGWQVQRLQGLVRAAMEACSATACCGVWLVEMVVGGRGMAPSGGRALHPPVKRRDEEDGFL